LESDTCDRRVPAIPASSRSTFRRSRKKIPAVRGLPILVLVLLAASCKRSAAPDGATMGSASSSASGAVEPPPGPCAEADRLGQEKRYTEALAAYRAVLARMPGQHVCLYNAGLTAYLAKDFAAAVDFWKELEAISPADGQLRAKLVQGYQALGRIGDRDRERAALFALWREGKDPDLQRRSFYCREQFEVDGKKVMADEHFELKGKWAKRYVFSVLGPAGNKPEVTISLGSYESTDAFARETGQVKEGERLFHLDGYSPDGSHTTYGMFKVEPTYEETREMVIKIVRGELRPGSSTLPHP
jgi:hypothetical protein